jgi:hypothetical protein
MPGRFKHIFFGLEPGYFETLAGENFQMTACTATRIQHTPGARCVELSKKPIGLCNSDGKKLVIPRGKIRVDAHDLKLAQC